MKIRFGMLATDAFGKAGGQCIQRRGSIRVLRNITIPTIRDASVSNPQRLLNSRLFNGWAFLPKSVRESWAVVGSNLSRVNGWGEGKTLSGREAYTSLNSLFIPYEGSVLNPLAVQYVIPRFELMSITLDVSVQQLEIVTNSVDEVYFYQIKALPLRSNAVNPGVSKLKTFARLADLSDDSEVYDLFTKAFGTVVILGFYAFAIRAVSQSGIPSPWQTLTIQEAG